MKKLLSASIYFLLFMCVHSVTEEDHGVKYANKCEGNHNKFVSFIML